MTEPRASPAELLKGLTSILVRADVFLRQKFVDYDDSPLRRCYQLAAGELVFVANEPETMSQDQWLVISARSYLNVRQSSTISGQRLQLVTELRQLADFIGLIPLKPSLFDHRELLRESILTLASAVNGPRGDATDERLAEEPVGDRRAAGLAPAILVASGTSENSQGAAQQLIAGLSDPSFVVINLTICKDIPCVLRELDRTEYSKAYSVYVLDKDDANDVNAYNSTEYDWFILFGILLNAATRARTYLALEKGQSEPQDPRFKPVADRLYWSRERNGDGEAFNVTAVASALRTVVSGAKVSN